MNNTTMRFLYYLSFLTIGIGLALSQSWLVWFGLAFMTYIRPQLYQQQPNSNLLRNISVDGCLRFPPAPARKAA
jgi:hypothetical protein